MSSKKKTRSKLVRAMGQQQMVRVSRSPKFATRIDGFVVGVGDKWTLIAQTSDGGFFDGYVAFRIRDIEKVTRDKSFEGVFARTQPEWPPTCPFDVDLDSVRGVLGSLANGGALIGIQREHLFCGLWIGKLDEVHKSFVYLHEVRPDATWRTNSLGYKLKSITSVEVATDYLRALNTVAGPEPSL